jgi:hypothetical protein
MQAKQNKFTTCSSSEGSQALGQRGSARFTTTLVSMRVSRMSIKGGIKICSGQVIPRRNRRKNIICEIIHLPGAGLLKRWRQKIDKGKRVYRY